MKNKKYKDLSINELVSHIDDLKKELFNLRFQVATAQLSNPMRIREVKRSIARAKTILTQKENQ